MSNIEQYRGASVSRSFTRQVGRGLARIDGITSLDVARVQSREDIQNAQVEAMASVTQRGLQGVAFISQVEQQLGQTVPMAVGRLQAIADIGALGISQVIMDTANKLRRI
jgi:hypothetical protein